jgi:hypothetical protein
MATSTIVLELKMRWWVPVYLRTITLLCLATQQEPDYDKVAGFIVRLGISKKVKACPSTT